MKEGIHPEYREVCFVDLSNGFKFVTRSCVTSKETTKMDDGRELPLIKLETTSQTHLFLHRHAEERGQPGRSRREVPHQVRPRRHQVRGCAHAKGSCGCLFVGRDPRA